LLQGIEMKIEELFSRDMRYEMRERKPSICSPMSKMLIKEQKSEPAKFENKVLTYLFENKNALGIEEVYALEKMLIDAAIKLFGGKLILIEVKYALNWRNCCNARVEFQRFIGEKLYENLPIDKFPERALIVFDHFSGDWDRKSKAHTLKNGWNFFYEEEKILRKKLPTIPVDIAQLTEKGLDNPLLRLA